MKHVSLTIAAILVAGCVGPTASSPRSNVNLSGYPPEFRQGYADGCASVQMGAARKRDEARFKSDANYMQGWSDGYDICQRRQ